MGFEPPARAPVYDWLATELRRSGYDRHVKPDKGLLRHYVVNVTGLTRAATPPD
mgnify:CR=1 FL=1